MRSANLLLGPVWGHFLVGTCGSDCPQPTKEDALKCGAKGPLNPYLSNRCQGVEGMTPGVEPDHDTGTGTGGWGSVPGMGGGKFNP